MGTGIVFGGSLAAAVVAGAIALFAPCCISVMLPAYFAGSFQNRRRQVAMTFVYAAGVATVVLPIALGAVLVRRLIFGQHTLVFALGGGLLVFLGLYTLAGGSLHLPMIGGGRPAKAGPLGVYSMGVVSGLATSCCAPVLAGVVALSGLASSFLAALALGGAYVFGMVGPLFAIALAWRRFEVPLSRLFHPRTISWRLGSLRRSLTGTALASGVLLVIMGGATLWMAATGVSMASTTGWQASMTAQLTHLGHDLTQVLSHVPGWAVATVILAWVALLARRAAQEIGWWGRPETEGAAMPAGHPPIVDRRTTTLSRESKKDVVEPTHA